MTVPETGQHTGGARAALTRPRDGRMVAGVAAGIGRYLGVDPVIVRLVFVVLALAGGGGLLAYVIAWIVMPDEPVDGQPAAPARGGTGAPVVAGLVLVALGGILLVERLVPAFSWRYVGPALLIALGVLLLARKGDPR